jgi:hypothetical protein
MKRVMRDRSGFCPFRFCYAHRGAWRATSAILLSLLALTACGRDGATPPPRTISLGGAVAPLEAHLHLPAPGAPLLLLITGHRRAPERWQPLLELLLPAGYAACVVSLPHPEQDWLSLLPALRAALDEAVAHGSDPANLFAGGEGLGGSLALHLALADPRVQAVVMLSPGLTAHGIETEQAIKGLTDCPVLLISTEDDAYAATSAQVLKAAAPVFSELRSYSGSAFGADLLSTAPSSSAQLVLWLDFIRKNTRDAEAAGNLSAG